MNNTPTDIHTADGIVMGGPWQIRHVPVAGIDVDDVRRAALGALCLVDQQMSNYANDSDLMQANHGPLNQWLPIPQDMHYVMSCALDYSDASNGALNIALGASVNAWGFGPTQTPDTAPDAETLAAQANSSNSDSFELRADPPAVFKIKDIAFDLCAIAKGFAVDQAARAVKTLGINSFLIEASGEIYAQGLRPDGHPWQVGLELPVPGKILVFDQLVLNGNAVATSGSYRNTRDIDGQTYSHTINPQTGAPIAGDLLTVTVVDPQCMRADALATVLYVLGPKKGPAYAEANKIAALFMIREDEGVCEIRSEEFVALA